MLVGNRNGKWMIPSLGDYWSLPLLLLLQLSLYNDHQICRILDLSLVVVKPWLEY